MCSPSPAAKSKSLPLAMTVPVQTQTNSETRRRGPTEETASVAEAVSVPNGILVLTQQSEFVKEQFFSSAYCH